MRLHLPVFALLALAGCTHSTSRTTSVPPPVAVTPLATSGNAVPLKPVDFAAAPSANPALLTVDSWLDDYFAVWRAHNEKLKQAAQQAHPKWASLLDALRRMESEYEALARYVFYYNHRVGTEGIFWAKGNWAQNVMPCSCGKIGRINTPEWERLFRDLSAARDEFHPDDAGAFWMEYRAAIKETEQSLQPALDAELARLKPGFLRFMREPTQPHSGH